MSRCRQYAKLNVNRKCRKCSAATSWWMADGWRNSSFRATPTYDRDARARDIKSRERFWHACHWVHMHRSTGCWSRSPGEKRYLRHHRASTFMKCFLTWRPYPCVMSWQSTTAATETRPSWRRIGFSEAMTHITASIWSQKRHGLSWDSEVNRPEHSEKYSFLRYACTGGALISPTTLWRIVQWRNAAFAAARLRDVVL